MADGYPSGRHGASQGHPSEQSSSRRSAPEQSSSTRTASGHPLPPPYYNQGHYTTSPHYSPAYNNSSPTGHRYIDPAPHANVTLSSPNFAQPLYATPLMSANNYSSSNFNYAPPNESSHAVYQSSPGPAMRPAALPTSFLGRPGHPTDHSDRRVGTSTGVVRNHICPTCGKGFGRPSSLAQHEFTHTGERPFVCPVCSKAFNTTSNLKRHQGLHEAS